jgi:S-adenosylmethionine:tRNA ribosyltransferase-isomerase
MMRPGKYAGLGKNILLMNNTGTLTKTHATVIGINADGHRRLCFKGTQNLISMLDDLGEVPLPPYITRNTDNDSNEDASRYQTVFAKANGSVAAPTAGLHFTNELMEKIRARGVKVCFVTLHVGAGTFAPVKTELIAEHRMHEERFELTDETRTAIRECKRAGNRVIAVGTTSLRVLESIAASEHKSNKEDSPKSSDSQPLSETLSGTLSGECASDKVPDKGPQAGSWVQSLVSSSSDNSSAPSALSSKSYTGKTRIFIHPPYNFRIVDVLLTNFHLPRSTLLMLVSAFASPGKTTGRELILNAYSEAIREHYRFFSYGDAMLIM